MDRWFGLFGVIFLGIPLGCNCSKHRSGGAEGPAAVAADASLVGNGAEAKPALLCTAVKNGAVFALGTETGSAEEDDSGLDVPFGINVGQAVGFEGGFAVSAVDGRAGKSHAILALMGKEAQNAKKLDLGRVHGDADPAHIAGDSRNLLVALADMDAAGRTLRLLRVEDPLGAARMTKGEDLSVTENSATVFSLALNGEHGIIVWEQPDKKTDLQQIALAHFQLQTLALPAKPIVFSGGKSDAESPQVVSRQGGFWLGWVQPVPKNAASPASKSGGKKATADDTALPVVDLGFRDLYVNSLDLAGHAVSKALRVTEGASHAVTYEMSTLSDGSAVLAWRDDDTSPGVQSQVIHLARVGLDGHVERFRIEDESIGVGEPQLLVDPTLDNDEYAWLALGNTGEKVSFVKLQPNANPVMPIVDDSELGVAYPLARFGGVLLAARQRGASVDLEPLRCRFGMR